MKDYFEKNKSSYNEMAPFYKIRRDRGDFKINEEIIKFSSLIEKQFQNPQILEIGPGAGVVLDYLSKKGFKTTAIDISDEMINIARENSPKTEYILGNFLDYNFNERIFEGVFAKSIFHLFGAEDASLFIKKSHELLINDGLMYLSFFLRNKSQEGFKSKNMEGKEFIRYSKNWTKEELKNFLDHSSFKIIYDSMTPYGTMNKWIGILKK